MATASWAEFRRLVPEGREVLPDRRFLPAVCRNLTRLASYHDPFLAQAYASSFGANSQILLVTADAVRALNEASIPVMALKGAALLMNQYNDIGIRPMSDADLLVPSSHIGPALDVLMAAGWSGSLAWLATGMHAGTLSHSGTTLDLHRHALYEARYSEADEAFFADARPAKITGVPCRVMGPEDQLLHSIVHGLRWSIAPSDIWILDAITVLRGGSVDGARVRSRAQSLKLVVPLRCGLRLVRSVFGGEEALDRLLVELESARGPITERVEHWFRVREPDGFLGAIPNLWFAHKRSAPPGKTPPQSFSGFLAQAWNLKSSTELPMALAKKAWRRLRPVKTAV